MIFKRGDLWIAGLIGLMIILSFLPRMTAEQAKAPATIANIEVNGKLYDTFFLTEESQIIEIRTARGYNLLKISDHGIEMIEADCPDQLCIGFGHIDKQHETIICLPHRVFVEVTDSADPGEGADYDAIVS